MVNKRLITLCDRFAQRRSMKRRPLASNEIGSARQISKTIDLEGRDLASVAVVSPIRSIHARLVVAASEKTLAWHRKISAQKMPRST